MNTSRRGFLAKIFASAIAAPAVTKLIANGITHPVKESECLNVTGVADWNFSGHPEWSQIDRGMMPVDYDESWCFSRGTFYQRGKFSP